MHVTDVCERIVVLEKGEVVKDLETSEATLKELEDLQGRTRDKKFGNRTLDLDLLTFDDTICENPVTLPRAEILYNAFVLKPMADLVPNQHHPVVHKTYAQLWEHFVSTSENNTQQLWPTDLPWSASTK